jgi:hypothetical protein
METIAYQSFILAFIAVVLPAVALAWWGLRDE